MPDITDAELAEFKQAKIDAAALKESATKLELKNKELLEEKKLEKAAREVAEKKATDAETQKLKDAGDYKALAERLDAQEKEREIQNKANLEKLEKGAKLSKVKDELNKLGLDAAAADHAMKLVDLAEMKYDPSMNLVSGADVVATKLKVALPQLFTKADPEKTKHTNPDNTPPSEMTEEWFKALSTEDQTKHQAAFMKAQGY